MRTPSGPDDPANSSTVGADIHSAPHYYINERDIKRPLSLKGAALTQDIKRPINYLGSKLRLIEQICETVDGIDPSGGAVCDLFAGSGTVSRAFSKKRDVISVDIQEYSRVLCSALLKPREVAPAVLEDFWRRVCSSEHTELLLSAVEPLAAYESDCLRRAKDGNLMPLCDLLEQGSLMATEQDVCGASYRELRDALSSVRSRLRRFNLSKGPDALATRHFGGLYFSFFQAAHLDILLKSIQSVPSINKDAFLAAALSTASELVNTVGKQFAQPLRPRTSDGRPKKNLYQLAARDRFADPLKLYEGWLGRYLAIEKSEGRHEILRRDYVQALEGLRGKVSVVYADPPYTRDHYSRFYHVLETFCLRDDPAVSTRRVNGEERISRGFYRSERHQSPFCIKSKASGAFSVLFERTRRLDVPLLVSYSPYERGSGARPRLLTVDEVAGLAKRFFRQVEVTRPARIAHNKLNSSEKNADVSYDAEVLVACMP